MVGLFRDGGPRRRAIGQLLKQASRQAAKQASSNMARALLVADPLFAATADNDAPEAWPGLTSDDTLSASEPHRARGHGLDLLRPQPACRKNNAETGNWDRNVACAAAF